MRIDIKATNLELTPAIREYIEMKIGALSRFLKRFDGSTSLTINPERRRRIEGSTSLTINPERRRRIEAKNEIEVFVEIARTTRHHKTGDVFCAEASFSIGKKLLRAEDIDWDIRVAIDKVKDKLKQEINKYKDKQIGRR